MTQLMFLHMKESAFKLSLWLLPFVCFQQVPPITLQRRMCGLNLFIELTAGDLWKCQSILLMHLWTLARGRGSSPLTIKIENGGGYDFLFFLKAQCLII